VVADIMETAAEMMAVVIVTAMTTIVAMPI
jgi:hypothetical protein